MCPHKHRASSATEILLTTLKHPASHVYLSLAIPAYLATNGHHQWYICLHSMPPSVQSHKIHSIFFYTSWRKYKFVMEEFVIKEKAALKQKHLIYSGAPPQPLQQKGNIFLIILLWYIFLVLLSLKEKKKKTEKCKNN